MRINTKFWAIVIALVFVTAAIGLHLKLAYGCPPRSIFAATGSSEPLPRFTPANELTSEEAAKNSPLVYEIDLKAKVTNEGIALCWKQKTYTTKVKYFDLYRKIPNTEGWGERIERTEAISRQDSYMFIDRQTITETEYQYFVFGIMLSGGYEIIELSAKPLVIRYK